MGILLDRFGVWLDERLLNFWTRYDIQLRHTVTINKERIAMWEEFLNRDTRILNRRKAHEAELESYRREREKKWQELTRQI